MDVASAGRGRVLPRRTLNRALLDRQWLLHRRTAPAAEAIEHLVAMQAQVPRDPYIGLWARLSGFRHDELSGLIAERRAVRMSLLRGTLHLASDRDCLAMIPILLPMHRTALHSGSPYGRRLHGLDIDALLAAGRALLDERPRTLAELRPLLHERWPDHDPDALVYAIRYLVPVVQIPPRGLWGRSGRPTWATVGSWLGRSVGSDDSPDEIVRRYLAAYGPATVGDFQAWSGMAAQRATFERMRSALVTYRDERGRELFDLPGAPLPDDDEDAPVRFLPEYDNAMLGHEDRSRIIPEEHDRAAYQFAGSCAVLVDGFLGATWRSVRDHDRMRLEIKPLSPLSTATRLSIHAEGARLLAFLGGDEADEVRIA